MRDYDKQELQDIIKALKDKNNNTDSMRVVGRGTLVKSASDVRNSQKYKDLLKKADKYVTRRPNKE